MFCSFRYNRTDHKLSSRSGCDISQVPGLLLSDFTLLLLLLLQLNPAGSVGQALVKEWLQHGAELGHDLVDLGADPINEPELNGA